MRVFELRAGNKVMTRAVELEANWIFVPFDRRVEVHVSPTDLTRCYPGLEVYQVADIDLDMARHLARNRTQDECEGVENDYLDKPHSYMWQQRGLFADMFRERRL